MALFNSGVWVMLGFVGAMCCVLIVSEVKLVLMSLFLLTRRRPLHVHLVCVCNVAGSGSGGLVGVCRTPHCSGEQWRGCCFHQFV